MIERKFDGTLEGVAMLDLALAPAEIETLRRIAVESQAWQEGRQGSGYFKLDMNGITTVQLSVYDDIIRLTEIRHRFLSVIRKRAGIETLPDLEHLMGNHDFWLLYYPEDSNVPMHLDPVAAGLEHHRVNACVTAPGEGGLLGLCDRAGIFQCRLDLAEGQGMVFRPDLFKHHVTHVLSGNRLVVSVGAAVKEKP